MSPLSLIALLLPHSVLGAEAIRLPVIADTSLQAHPSEVNCNSGASSVIRIKGNEHYMLLKFDLAPLQGQRVAQATLHLHNAHPNLLRTVGLSTIAADWQEGTGTGGPATDGCTFTRAVWPDKMWAGPGSDFLDVAITHGNTIVRYVDIRQEPDDWFAVDVDPLLVDAMMCGFSYGLCLSDEKGQTMANNDVHSREQNAFAPYMAVEPEIPSARLAALTLAPVAAEPWPAAATFDTGAIRVRLTSPGALGYRVQCDPAYSSKRTELPRYLIPQPAPAGQEQSFVIPGLKPGVPYEVRVQAVAYLGRESNVQALEATASAAKAKPAPLAAPRPVTKVLAQPQAVGSLRAWICPAECKVHPVSANVLEEVGAARYGGPLAGAYAGQNPVWLRDTAYCKGARGEVVAVQLIVETTKGTPVSFSVQFAPGAANPMPNPVGVYRNWYVNDGDWYADYMAPMPDGKAMIPAPDNAVPGQRNQSFTIVWELPRDARQGEATGQVRVVPDSGGPGPVIPIRMWVRNFEVPAKTSFELDLNCYGPVCQAANWDDYLARERKFFAAAHALRGTLNPLGYSHSGNNDFGWVPQVSGAGKDIRVTDWSVYDRHWGPYLDGSAFGGVRAGVPVSHIYLPLYEGWPTPMDGHYTGGNDIRKYPDNIIAHAMTAPPVEQAFDSTLKEAFVSVTRQFVEHFAERRWLQTDMQCYQNDKYYYKDEKSNFRGISWWLLDEPMHRDDWLALRLFAGLYREGLRLAGDTPAPRGLAGETPAPRVAAEGMPAARGGEGPGPRFIYRGDISRPQYQRDWLDGRIDLMCVSSELFAHPQYCRRFRDQGVTLWHYGEANPISQTNLTAVGWALKAYCAGADGILPWNSIGGPGALTQPDPTGLLIPGDRFGATGPVVSLRLLALCRGQEDVEYLNLLAKRRGYDRDQMARLVSDFVGLSGRQQQTSAEDAGRLQFDMLSPEQFSELREAVARELEK
jgi:hypothetical protein